ncbi:MAG: SDR family NAD(P)-dependent oxidoreductase [Desulfovibrio sp.]|jgi:short-subunit dehydrogenase|nr:SDR family NAD(P)-dependent oxidoreductase [Desulfovibrio sp.]
MPDEMRHILISGASGGLGGALAERLAQPDVSLSLWGRDTGRLAQIDSRCQTKGASVSVVRQDLRDPDAVCQRLQDLDAERPVDVAIFNAGVSSGLSPDGGFESAAAACRTLMVNTVGAVGMAALLLERMARRDNGHLVFISSLAALYPLPGSPAYSASKAALSVYARAVRSGRAGKKPRISIVYPGYVDTPMSQRIIGPQPLRWSADKAASYIVARLEAGADIIAFPFFLFLGIRLLSLLPSPAADMCLRFFSFSVEPDKDSLLSLRQQRQEQDDPDQHGDGA